MYGHQGEESTVAPEGDTGAGVPTCVSLCRSHVIIYIGCVSVCRNVCVGV